MARQGSEGEALGTGSVWCRRAAENMTTAGGAHPQGCCSHISATQRGTFTLGSPCSSWGSGAFFALLPLEIQQDWGLPKPIATNDVRTTNFVLMKFLYSA